MIIDGKATVASAVEVAELQVKPTAQLTIATGNELTVTGDFTLESNASQTATFLNQGSLSVGGSAVAQQYLTVARQWWYMASPVVGATSSAVFGTNKIGDYSEPNHSYSDVFSEAVSLQAGKGYAVKLDAEGVADGIFAFSGTDFFDGNLTLTPTRTVTGTAGDAKRGFNLIGNPYPSYLNWNAAYNEATNLRTTIWYRTRGASAMEFVTYNASLGVSVPAGINGYIPPMQAFWVRVDADNTPASLTFKNTHRSHMEATGYNPLKAKSADLRPRVRLVISNGEADDEMLLVGKSYAANGLDSYDIEKLSNDNAAIPELYSLVENQELVINSMQELNAGKWVMLGMRPGEAGSFNITASQLDNIDAMVVLKDRLLNVEKELTLGETYSFTSDGIASNDRFSLEFRAPGTVTSVNNLVSDAQIFINENRQLTVQAPGITLNDRISIYNMAGQQLLTQQANGPVTVLAEPLSIGVYIVKVNELVQKVVVK